MNQSLSPLPHRAVQFSDTVEVARGFDQHQADLRIVEAQAQERVVDFAEKPQRIEVRTKRRRVGRDCRDALGSFDDQLGQALGAIETQREMPVADFSLGLGGSERVERDPGASGSLRIDECRDALGHRLVEARARRDRIDQPPFDRALATHALGQRGEDVGEVAAHLALVDQAREAAGAGQHAEKCDLGQAHGRAAVVDQDYLLARERQFVTATAACAVERGDVTLAAVGGRVFDRKAGLVGKLAEVDFEAVVGVREHEDVGAGAEHPVQGAIDRDHADARMLEAQARHGVGKLDIHREIVRVELERVAGGESAGFIDLHREPRAVARGFQFPVPIAARIGLKLNRVHFSPALPDRLPDLRYARGMRIGGSKTICNIIHVGLVMSSLICI